MIKTGQLSLKPYSLDIKMKIYEKIQKIKKLTLEINLTQKSVFYYFYQRTLVLNILQFIKFKNITYLKLLSNLYFHTTVFTSFYFFHLIFISLERKNFSVGKDIISSIHSKFEFVFHLSISNHSTNSHFSSLGMEDSQNFKLSYNNFLFLNLYHS